MILDNDLIQKINLFERLTKAIVKDVFDFNGLLIIVNFGDIRKAVGKNGVSIKRYSDLIKEKVKIVEYNHNDITFLKNLIMPLKVDILEKEDGFINVSADTKTKALLIGRNQKNLGQYNKILKKYFNINIKVR